MSVLIDTVREVDTPEHLAFKARIAGPSRRLLAWLLDLVVQFFVAIALLMIIGAVSSVGPSGLGTGLSLFLIFILQWFYFTIAETITGGRSLGKIAFKLRVVRPNGLPITWRESILRNFLRAADHGISPTLLLFGPIVMMFNKSFQRLGDLAAGTIVVVEESVNVKSTPTLEADPKIVAELPGLLPLDQDDLEALELFVSRERMSDARRDELAAIVAPHYAKRLAVPNPKNPTQFLAALWARAQDPTRRIGV